MEHKKKKKIKLRHIIIIVLFINIVVVFIGQQERLNQLNDDIAKREMTIEEINRDNLELREEAELMGSSEYRYEYIEKMAREKMKMVKPGETIYIDRDKVKNKFIEGIGY